MSAHNELHELLMAFMPGGPGRVPLVASAAGTKMSDEAFIQMVIPTWGNTNNILILPAPVPGRIVMVAGAATGGELRTTDPVNVKINGVGGSNFESLLPANAMAILICESPTNWKGFTVADNGTPGQLAVPDA
jgi:hypothetical protein